MVFCSRSGTDWGKDSPGWWLVLTLLCYPFFRVVELQCSDVFLLSSLHFLIHPWQKRVRIQSLKTIRSTACSYIQQLSWAHLWGTQNSQWITDIIKTQYANIHTIWAHMQKRGNKGCPPKYWRWHLTTTWLQAQFYFGNSHNECMCIDFSW
jgi:hypothetical protein